MSLVGRRTVALVAALAVVLGGLGAHAQPAEASHNAAVVVIDTGASVRTVTVRFHEPHISGLRALELAGANPVTRPYGPGLAVCQLDGVGHSPANCLGTPSDPRYWTYFRAPAGSGGWAYSSMGAGASQVRNGDWEGWRFGTGAQPRVAPPAPPPAASPGQGGGAPGGGGAGGAGGGASGGGPAGGDPASQAPDPGQGGSRAGSDPSSTDDPILDPQVEGTTTEEEVPRDDGDERDRDGLEAAPAATGTAGASGSGSPVGVIVAALLAAALVAAAIVIHRRRTMMRS